MTTFSSRMSSPALLGLLNSRGVIEAWVSGFLSCEGGGRGSSVNALEMFSAEKVALSRSDTNRKSVGESDVLDGMKRYTVEESLERSPVAGCGGAEDAVRAIVRVERRRVMNMWCFIVRRRALETRENWVSFPVLLHLLSQCSYSNAAEVRCEEVWWEIIGEKVAER